MKLFDSKYKVEKVENPKTKGTNIYPYKVTSKKTGDISYLSDKGLKAIKNRNK